MYKILRFSGGVYKFELLAEHVEDVGGLLFQENRLHISRGASFLSEEIQVIFLVPTNEVSSVKELTSEIKGEIEEVEVEDTLKNNLINSLEIYNIMCKADDWIKQDVISDEYHGNPEEYQENLEECLDLMISLELIKKRTSKGKSDYRVLKENDK
jgi:hypothetical protein